MVEGATLILGFHGLKNAYHAPFLKDCKGGGCRRRAGQTKNERVCPIQVKLQIEILI